jgi:hypothetical protein
MLTSPSLFKMKLQKIFICLVSDGSPSGSIADNCSPHCPSSEWRLHNSFLDVDISVASCEGRSKGGGALDHSGFDAGFEAFCEVELHCGWSALP